MPKERNDLGLSGYVPDLAPDPRNAAQAFWKEYNRMARGEEANSFADLNQQLDKLPLFGGLFSAVNTAIIALAMPSLSPNPIDNTNTLLQLLVMKAENSTLAVDDTSSPFSPDRGSVIASCLLYASLCCSIIAASGALIGQEWLLNLEETGAEDSNISQEARGQSRIAKWVGIEQWRLVTIIRLLPNLLTLSILLFFPGLFIFLLKINTTVAYVVLSSTALPMLTIVLTTVAAAVDPSCPFQNSASHNLRAIGVFLSSILHTIFRIPTPNSISVTPKSWPEEWLNTKAVLSMLQNWFDPYVVAAGRLIPSLDPKGFAAAVRDHGGLPRLLESTSQAIRLWRDHPYEHSQMLAEYYVFAVHHYLFGQQIDGGITISSEVRRALPLELFEDPAEPEILGLMKSIIYPIPYTMTGMTIPSTGYLLRVAFLQNVAISQQPLDLGVVGVFLGVDYDNVIINLLATCVVQSSRPLGNRRGSVMDLYLGKQIQYNLAAAVSTPVFDWAFSACLRHSQGLRLAFKIYIPFLGMLKRLAIRGEVTDRQLFTELDLSLKANLLRLRRWTALNDTLVVQFVTVAISTFVTIRGLGGLRAYERDECLAITDGLEYVVSELGDDEDEAVQSGINTAILETLQHITTSLRTHDLDKLGDRTKFASYFISAIIDPVGEKYEQSLEYFSNHPQIWVPTEEVSKAIWIRSNITKKLLQLLMIKDLEFSASKLHLVRVMQHMDVWMGPSWAPGLVRDGVIDIAVDLMSSSSKSQEVFNMRHDTLILLLQLWKRSAQEFDGNWTTDEVISAVGWATTDIRDRYTCPSPAEVQRTYPKRFGETDIGPHTLVEFFDYIRKYRGDQVPVLESLRLDTLLREFRNLDNLPASTP